MPESPTAWAFPAHQMGYNRGMEAFVLGWDLERGTRWVPPYEHVLAGVCANGTTTAPWSIGEGPTPAPGSRVHLMLQGRVRGLVGRGTVCSAPYAAGDPGHPGTLAQHVLVDWDHLLPIEERISVDELSTRVPALAWQELYAPVHALSSEDAARIERAWVSPHPSARPGRSRFRGGPSPTLVATDTAGAVQAPTGPAGTSQLSPG
jgi:hypothetical protein